MERDERKRDPTARRPAADVSYWDGRPPVTTVMDVPGETWESVVDRYRPRGNYAPVALHALVTAIRDAWWSRGLHAQTSMYTVVIAQTAPFDMYGHDVLRVWPRRGEMIFAHDGWQTSCPEDEAFAKLEHILRNRLKWIVGDREEGFRAASVARAGAGGVKAG